jgi:hypothetical protein
VARDKREGELTRSNPRLTVAHCLRHHTTVNDLPRTIGSNTHLELFHQPHKSPQLDRESLKAATTLTY